MRGPPGTTVRVRVRREGAEEDLPFRMQRAVIEVPPVEARLLEDGVLHVRVTAFQDGTTAQLEAALDRALGERAAVAGDLEGVLLDLRGNPGGLLRGRGDGGPLRAGGRHRVRGAGRRSCWKCGPMRAGLAGLAPRRARGRLRGQRLEIVAGALQDHERAVLVEAQTFGKGSVQHIIELPDGSAMKLTVALYTTPSGRSIRNLLGILPDVVVEAVPPEAWPPRVPRVRSSSARPPSKEPSTATKASPAHRESGAGTHPVRPARPSPTTCKRASPGRRIATLRRGRREVESDLIAFEGVRKAFGPKVVYRHLDLTVEAGETLTVIGGSGQGKSVR